MTTRKRRNFIQKITFGSLFISLSFPFKSLFGSAISSPPSWIKLLDIAKWSPTIHNLQPQKLQIISENEAHLFYNPKRLLPIGDPDSVFATVAMGIFIEHLSISASDYGYQVNVIKLFNDISIKQSKDTLFAKLTLTKRKTKEIINPELITQRRTSRKKYDGIPVSSELLNIIKKESIKFNHDFFYTSDVKLINHITEINQEALFDDLANNPIREEIDHLFRYNKKDAESKKDGLWAKCMGFAGALLRSVFQNHEGWTKGIKRILLKETYMSSFKGTSTIGWFGGDFKTKENYINCGRMMARCWLLITKEGAYIHPFGSLITNKKANKKINLSFTQPSSGKIWMIFRVGYSKKPARSYRLNTKDYLIT